MHLPHLLQPLQVRRIPQFRHLGPKYFTEQKGAAEFHAYFYRTEVKQEEKDIPMRPAALTNMPLIDEKLGNIAVNFWDLTWNDENRY